MQDVTAEGVRARELTYSRSGTVGVWFIIASMFLAHIDWKTFRKTLLCRHIGSLRGKLRTTFWRETLRGIFGIWNTAPGYETLH